MEADLYTYDRLRIYDSSYVRDNYNNLVERIKFVENIVIKNSRLCKILAESENIEFTTEWTALSIEIKLNYIRIVDGLMIGIFGTYPTLNIYEIFNLLHIHSENIIPSISQLNDLVNIYFYLDMPMTVVMIGDLERYLLDYKFVDNIAAYVNIHKKHHGALYIHNVAGYEHVSGIKLTWRKVAYFTSSIAVYKIFIEKRTIIINYI